MSQGLEFIIVYVGFILSIGVACEIGAAMGRRDHRKTQEQAWKILEDFELQRRRGWG